MNGTQQCSLRTKVETFYRLTEAQQTIVLQLIGELLAINEEKASEEDKHPHLHLVE